MEKHALKILGSCLILAIVYVLTSASCLPKSVATAVGQFLGKKQEVPVDNPIAQQIIAGQTIETLKKYDTAPLSNQTVFEIQKAFSRDVATLYTLRRLYEMPHNQMVQNRYHQFVEALNNGQQPHLTNALRNKILLFVPGLAYKQDTTTGADFARQRRLLSTLGIENQLVETDEWGVSENNAAVIRAAIKQLSFQSKEIIVVSASKGGLETALALGKLMPESETKKVVAWVSICGILNGSIIADDYLTGLKCTFAKLALRTKGKNLDIVRDMSYRNRQNTIAQLQLPPHLRVIHFVGIPLTAQVHDRIKSRYCSIQKYLGPNDGLTTIPDMLTPQGYVVSELGLDHYFKDSHIDKKTLSLACVALSVLDNNSVRNE
jgi:hypothetical protein